MVQLVLMGMWQETGASREKSELKATQVKLCTQKRCIKLRLFWKTSAEHHTHMHKVPQKETLAQFWLL